MHPGASSLAEREDFDTRFILLFHGLSWHELPQLRNRRWDTAGCGLKIEVGPPKVLGHRVGIPSSRL